LLDIDVRTPQLRKWVASADLSEVAQLAEAALREKVEKSIEVPTDQGQAFEADLKSLIAQVERIAGELPLRDDPVA
jgi:hypothetical protein